MSDMGPTGQRDRHEADGGAERAPRTPPRRCTTYAASCDVRTIIKYEEANRKRSGAASAAQTRVAALAKETIND